LILQRAAYVVGRSLPVISASGWLPLTIGVGRAMTLATGLPQRPACSDPQRHPATLIRLPARGANGFDH